MNLQPAYSLYLITGGGGQIGLATVTTTWVQGGAIITSIDDHVDHAATAGPNVP